MEKISQNGQLYRRVDEILYYVWDPIGVSDAGATRGEYESHVMGVLRLVEKNESPEAIALYLTEIANKQMGFAPNDQAKARDLKVAALLLEHKWAIEEGLR